MVWWGAVDELPAFFVYRVIEVPRVWSRDNNISIGLSVTPRPVDGVVIVLTGSSSHGDIVLDIEFWEDDIISKGGIA